MYWYYLAFLQRLNEYHIASAIVKSSMLVCNEVYYANYHCNNYL